MAGATVSLSCGASPTWYHRDLSRAAAEELLARAGRDGSFLVRDSESVNGAYALCVLFQKHVHTYRILPDEEDFLAVQTSQGVQVKRYKTLPELVQLYLQPNQGLVTTLLYPVDREKDNPEDRDYSDGEDDKPPLPPRTASTSNPASSSSAVVLTGHDTHSEGAANGLSTISHDYLKGSYALDLEAVKQGASNLPHLNKTLVTSCKRLHGEVDKVLAGLEILSKVFDQQSSVMVSRMIQQTNSQSGDQELENLVTKLSILKDLLSSIEKKALKALQDMSSPAFSLPSAPFTRHQKTIPVQFFEVKLDVNLADLTKIGKSQKYTLSVDVEAGKLVVTKKLKDSQEDWNTFTYDKIRQLIKSQRFQNKLGIVFEKEKDKSQRKDFIFASAKKREAFCQLLQLMKNRHSNQDEPDMISVFIGTWNMGSVPCPKNISSWIMSKGLGKTLDEIAVNIPHDIYVIGTQENSICDREWVEILRGALKEFSSSDIIILHFKPIVVLVKPEHENRISHVGISSVKTGIANTLGNKGAVGISFIFNGTSFGFVNCHLTSGNEKTARRNQNYIDILRLLSLGDKQLNSFDISLRFTHLFWFGDLNYRLDMDIQEILNYISRKEFEALLKVDQLNLEREKNKVFLRFAEEDITFPPTYRYERGSRDTYVWQKQKPTGMRTNVPSWCDRILWKSYPETHIVCNSYGILINVSSDVKPYLKKLGIQMYSPKSIKLAANTTEANSHLFFFCFTEFKKSYENDTQSSDNINFLKVGWSSKQLTTLKPILSDIEYLQDQHLLLTVKSVDGYESYGECVLALKSMIGSTAQQFHTYLSHRGEETGNIRGSMRVRVPSERMGTRERLYEWISIDKDETGGLKGKHPSCSRSSHDYVKHISNVQCFNFRPKQDTVEGETNNCRNSYNNPAYYILEGVPNQSAAMSSDISAASAIPPLSSKVSVGSTKSKSPLTVVTQQRRQGSGPPSNLKGEGASPEEEGTILGDGGTLNRPPPDFPPPPLPKSVVEINESHMHSSNKDAKLRNMYPDLSDMRTGAFPKPLPSPGFLPSSTGGASGVFSMESPPAMNMMGPSFKRSGGQHGADDQSCSVLQMAKTLSEVEYQPSRDRNPPLPVKNLSSQPLRGLGLQDAFQTRSIRECIEEGLNEEPSWHGSSSSSSLSFELSVGDWLRRFGLERYEEGLLHNGWDDLEFLSDITEEDLEEAGVLDPTHKKIILENLRLQK
uniref:phosphatidylinositol-3,4,5-trisphosphate 5-phosphatase n=1 Tax=Erpetoichthys calabaricus TaxID=27687 RepID=A0A8C4X5P1_ERPCA